MAKVVEHTHEEDEVELLADAVDVVDVHLGELDLDADDARREARLLEVGLIGVDAEHARGAAALHLDRVEAAVAADVEHSLAAQVARERVLEALELDARIVAEEMPRRRHHAAEVHVVVPGAALADALRDLFTGHRALASCRSSGRRRRAWPPSSFSAASRSWIASR